MLLPHAIAQIKDTLPSLRRGQADIAVTLLQTILEHLEEVQAELDAERNGRGIDAAEIAHLETIVDTFRRFPGTPVMYWDMFKALDRLRNERRNRELDAQNRGESLRGTRTGRYTSNTPNWEEVPKPGMQPVFLPGKHQELPLLRLEDFSCPSCGGPLLALPSKAGSRHGVTLHCRNTIHGPENCPDATGTCRDLQEALGYLKNEGPAA